MRGLLVAVLLAAAAWTGYWWTGSTAIENGVNQWFADHPNGDVSIAKAEVHGIPNRFDLTLTDLQIDRPDQRLRWQTPFAQVFAMTWKPWHVIAALPTGQTITYQDQTLTLNSSRMRGDVIVHPSTTAPLQEIIAESADLELISNAGWRISLANLLASLREDPTSVNRYRLGLRLTDLIPDASLNPALAEAGLPPRIDEAYLDAHTTLSAPLNRRALETRPQVLEIDLGRARLTWAEMKFSATGKVAPDAQGFAAGEIDLHLEGWQKLPPLLVALGVVQPKMQLPITNMLTGMASADGDAKALDLKLIAKNGRMQLGPFPLGPAPMLAPLVN
jgi:hypothetical protein